MTSTNTAIATALPAIDPAPLSPGQRAGSRCAVPNCGRRLRDLAYPVGWLPGGLPVLVCEDCAPGVRYTAVTGAVA